MFRRGLLAKAILPIDFTDLPIMIVVKLSHPLKTFGLTVSTASSIEITDHAGHPINPVTLSPMLNIIL